MNTTEQNIMGMDDRKDFHLKRKQGIGGSDAGSIFGLSTYKSLVQLYLEKATDFVPTFSEEQQKVLNRGRELEPLLKPLFEKKFQLKLNCDLPQIIHPKHNFIVGNVDGEVVGGEAMIEFKTNMQFSRSNFGDEFTDEIPKSYLLQVHHYLMLSEKFTCAYVPVFTADTTTFQILQNCVKKYGIDDSILQDVDYSFKLYIVHKDETHEKLAKVMIKKYSLFWNEYVLKKIAPTAQSLGDIKLLFPTAQNKAILAEDKELEAIEVIKQKEAIIKSLEVEVDEYKLQLCKKLQSANVIIDEFGKPLCTYNNVYTKKFDTTKFVSEHEELAQQFYKTRPSRRLVIK